MVPSFRTPLLLPAVIVPLLLKASRVADAGFRKPRLADAVIVPLLVKVALVAFARLTASLVPSIVTPELIVTLEPFPSISKSEQLAVTVTVVPETSVQFAARTVRKCPLNDIMMAMSRKRIIFFKMPYWFIEKSACRKGNEYLCIIVISKLWFIG